ncbi:GntR family transcriptional regulator [Microbacterium sp. TWP3-1-2b2]|uniref:GntR family transcriptional regulator n=1 Tax=Microbacterium sp. TWP3-1-2b2 TaxID=2804651 RepID=UPI003CF14995
MARPSTVDLITAELRKAIFTGALPVGSPIGEVEMSSQLGVSRSPLRESTQRLVQEGLLTASPGRGMRVSVIGPEHVADVYDARLAIECQAVRLIIKAGAASVIDGLERAYQELVTVSEGTDARAIGDADIVFHRVLVDSAGSRRLSHYMATLAIETRIASFSDPSGYTVRRSVSDTYRELLAAVAAGDLSSAFAALERQFAEAVARLTGKDDDVETVETPADEEPPAIGPIELTEEV